MKHPVQLAVERIAKRATRWQRIVALCQVAGVFLAAMLVTSLVDYVLRVQDPGVRIILSCVTLLAVLAAAWYTLWPALRCPWSAMQVARRLEQRWPELQTRLSSTLAFLGQDPTDPAAGSLALRRAVVVETEAALSKYDLNEVLNRRILRRGTLWCAVLLLIVSGVSIWRPRDAWRAVQRAAVPWNAVEWPRVNDLSFVAPRDASQVALGSSVEFRVVDRNGNLPRAVTLLVWQDGDSAADIRKYDMEFRGGVMVTSLEEVSRSLRYRVAGGDDDRRIWRRLSVVDPPRVDQLTLHLRPPDYTGWPTDTAPGNARVLEETHVGLGAVVSQPLQQATFVVASGDEQPHLRRALQLSADGRRASLALDPEQDWLVKNSAEYWLELVSAKGIKSLGDQKWQVTALPDRPPSIIHREPVPAEVLALADLPLSLIAKDDLAVHTVQLRYSRSDQTDIGEIAVDLFRGPDRAGSGEVSGSEKDQNKVGIGALGTEQTQHIEYSWKLSELAGLTAGATLSMSVVATDYKGQESSTGVTRLRVLDESQLLDGIAHQQSLLLGQVVDLLRNQRELLGRTEEAHVEWTTSPASHRSAVDRLQAIELNQRDLQGRLVAREDAVLARARDLLRQLQVNGITSSQVGQRLQQIERVVLDLDRNALDPLHRHLIALVKQAQEPEPRAPEIAEGLQIVVGHQQQVVTALEQLVDEQAVWDTLRQFAREASELLLEQQELSARVHDARLDATASGSEGSGTASLQLESFARRQSDIARRLDKLRLQMDQMVSQPERQDPSAVARLDDALQIAEREAIGGRMRDTARTIRDGKLGRAVVEQQAILEAMQQLVDSLQRRGGTDAHGLAQKLREAQSDLDAALEQLKGLRRKSEALAHADQAPTNSVQEQRQLEILRREREELAEKAQELANRLQRLTAQSASDQTRRASESMQQANAEQQKGKRAAAAEADAQAEQHLRNARDQVAEQVRQEEQRLRDRQMARLEQIVRGWLGQQQSLLDDARRLAELRGQTRQWSAGERDSVMNLAQQQRGLAAEVATAMGTLAESEVFALALQSAIHQMQLAATELDQAVASDPTKGGNLPEREAVVRQETALKRLQQVLRALETEPDPENPLENPIQEPTPQPQPDAPVGNSPQSQADALRSIEELKLLKTMQEDIAERTLQLDQARREQGRLSDQQQQELKYLAEEQGQLAVLAEQLVRRAQQAADPPDGTDAAGESDATEQRDDSLEESLERSLQDPF